MAGPVGPLGFNGSQGAADLTGAMGPEGLRKREALVHGSTKLRRDISRHAIPAPWQAKLNQL